MKDQNEAVEAVDECGFEITSVEDSGSFDDESGWPTLAAFIKQQLASILYCLSAVSILYGVARLVGPILADSEKIWELLRCAAALNVYEIALLGVLLVIVRWKKVLDDAVSLVLVSALLLVASGITVDTVAVTGPDVALGFGFLVLGLGVFKLEALRRWIGLRLTPLMVAGGGAVLGWSFLISPRMAAVQEFHHAGAGSLRLVWQGGWLVMLAALIPLLIDALRLRNDDRGDTPLLRSRLMGWVFMMILVIGSAVHQFTVGYSFGLDTLVGDYFAAFSAIVLLLVILASRFGLPGKVAGAIAAGPLAVGMLIMVSGWFDPSLDATRQLVSYPPFILGLLCCVMFGCAILWRREGLLHLSAAYLCGTLLSWGVQPGGGALVLNWSALAFVMGIYITIAIIIKRSLPAAVAGVLMIAGASRLSPVLVRWADAVELGGAQQVWTIAGIGLVALYLLFKDRMPLVLVTMGALALSACAIAPGDTELLIAVVGTALAVAVWLRSRDALHSVILITPLSAKFWQIVSRSGHWRFVLLSFMLLALGAAVSLKKGRRAHE